ncbi:peptidylprolyl isomerase [Nocardia sp. XZ_19_385]|uniref:peptidylprolyl isomerase n=1 Tax=Nocardia sp. XZ_19_385 TaxID=2769488 RepID=UPI002815C5F2|nr:peptidylprolyl isomerase [Nocardia sp. XZ_19_385]
MQGNHGDVGSGPQYGGQPTHAPGGVPPWGGNPGPVHGFPQQGQQYYGGQFPGGRPPRNNVPWILGVIGSVAVVLIAGVGLFALSRSNDDNGAAPTTAPTSSTTATASLAEAGLPAAKPKAALVSCAYTDTAEPAAKPVTKPKQVEVTTTGADAKVSMSMQTSTGSVGLALNKAESPCTVNSFVSLVKQKYFDGTSCHRMTTGQGLKVLQCGDPTGTGMGGPGYQFANEYPTDQFTVSDPSAQIPVDYKRGVLAMANAGPGTNGSQFFIVFGDSQLPPQYTIFGTVNASGLATLDKIAAGGSDDSNGPDDGKPKIPVKIESIQLGN